MPKWAKAIAASSAVTMMMVLALWLTYTLTGELRSDSRSTNDMLRLHALDTIEIKNALEEMRRSQESANDSQLLFLRQVCVNTSTDVAQRAACLNIGRR